MAEKTFVVDFRESNPKLHRLYVKGAAIDLALIDKQMKKLADRCRTPLFGILAAMEAERAKLVDEEAAYHDADVIIRSMKAGDDVELREEIEAQEKARQDELLGNGTPFQMGHD
jgi:hypothetical protein